MAPRHETPPRLTLLVAAAAALAAPAGAQDAPALTEHDLVRGRVHYVAACARCHGVNGGGGEGPPLARPVLPRAPDDAALSRLVRAGLPGTAMGGTYWLSETELRQLVGYVRSLAPADAAAAELPGDAERGREVYERMGCNRCHTVDGFGTNRGPDLTTLGLRRGPVYLREAVLDPGAALPRGLTPVAAGGFVDYLPVRVVDSDGNEVRGMRMNEDTYTIQIRDQRGMLRSYYKPRLRELEKVFDSSLMRSYRDRLTDEEVDDLVRYLMTLTGSDARVIS